MPANGIRLACQSARRPDLCSSERPMPTTRPRLSPSRACPRARSRFHLRSLAQCAPPLEPRALRPPAASDRFRVTGCAEDGAGSAADAPESSASRWSCGCWTIRRASGTPIWWPAELAARVSGNRHEAEPPALASRARRRSRAVPRRCRYSGSLRRATSCYSSARCSHSCLTSRPCTLRASDSGSRSSRSRWQDGPVCSRS